MVPYSQRDLYDIVIDLPNNKHEFRPCQVAEEIYGHILDICIKAPKRYTRLIYDKLMDLATDLVNYVQMANSIIPETLGDYRLRRDFTLQARAALTALTKRMNVFVLNPKHLMSNYSEQKFNETWALLEEERKLLNTMAKSDRERYATGALKE